MKAIVLAAGIGQRLGNIAEKRPKCLLEFGGISLLKRHLDILLKIGVSNIIVVSGYESRQIEQEISISDAKHITRTVHNPEYRKGSLISLMEGLKVLNTDQDFILMDADVLYDGKIIERLVGSQIRNCFLLDREFIPGDEPVKLCVKNGQIIDFRKHINKDLEFDFQGESVGFFRFTAETADKIMNLTKSYLAQGCDDAPYEEIIRDLLLEEPDNYGFEDITGLKWIEIDFPEDLIRANSAILPHI